MADPLNTPLPVIRTAAEALEESALETRRGLAQCSGGPSDSPLCAAELQPLPEKLTDGTVEQKGPARWAYERVLLYLQTFEQQLDRNHEIALGFAGSDAGVLKIEGVGFFDPDILTFYGRTADGARTQLIQHVSQLNLMLQAVPKDGAPEEEPRRFGFHFRPDDATTTPLAEGETAPASARDSRSLIR